MKIIKVIYNNQTTNILDELKNIKINHILETYNIDFYKDRKKAIPIMTRFGTKNVPLIVFADENMEEYAAIWNESNSKITSDLITSYLNEISI
jgi:uncharacterized membrane protein YoaT (DUF817 family)